MAFYVWLTIGPSNLVIGGWVGTLAAAVWIGQKLSRELVYGGMRFKNARAVDARPPAPAPESPPEEGRLE